MNAIRKDDMNQSVIRLGHIGGLMSDPDYLALMVMNEILGGGFTSRLFKNVRSRQGLAYSVGGAYGADFDHPGLFSLSCQTKLKSTVHAIRGDDRRGAQDDAGRGDGRGAGPGQGQLPELVRLQLSTARARSSIA